MLEAPLHECAAVVAFGQELVVRPAEHADVGDGGGPAAAEGLLVMELEQSALLATLAVRTEVAAARTVAHEHGAPDRVRDVTLLAALAGVIAPAARLGGRAEAALHALGDQQVQRPLDH